MSSSPASALRRTVAGAQGLLLDFDGPVCAVFAGTSPASVAQQLRRLVVTYGSQLPPSSSESDPLQLLAILAEGEHRHARTVETALSEAELAAVRTATPTPGARELLDTCRSAGRRVGIVSNNSQAAIEFYLKQHDLDNAVDTIMARTNENFALLKPNPHLLQAAIDALDVPPENCTLVGDSESDIQAANAAGVTAVGYANKPGKAARLTQAGATAIIHSIGDLAQALRTVDS